MESKALALGGRLAKAEALDSKFIKQKFIRIENMSEVAKEELLEDKEQEMSSRNHSFTQALQTFGNKLQTCSHRVNVQIIL
jgi:hypothetical protein